jgi:putative chitinase
MITAPQLKHICPSITKEALAIYPALLTTYMEQYEINTKKRIAPFLANIALESDSFHATREYASGKEYEGRQDLGNLHPGDGVKYKGRGLIQITGATMYHLCSIALGKDFVEHPELLESPAAATASACWFWAKVKGLNEIADMPDEWTKPGPHHYPKFEWIVRLINGGVNGLHEREEFLKRANEIL